MKVTPTTEIVIELGIIVVVVDVIA